MAFAAPAAVTSSFMEEGCRRLRGLGDLVRADAARADFDALGAAANDGANHLKVGLEATGAHVVRVGHAAAYHRTFTADFTLHCHCRKLLETGKQKILSRFRRSGNSRPFLRLTASQSAVCRLVAASVDAAGIRVRRGPGRPFGRLESGRLRVSRLAPWPAERPPLRARRASR